MYLLIHCRAICDSERLKRTQLYISKGLVQQTVVHQPSGGTYICKGEGGQCAYTSMGVTAVI